MGQCGDAMPGASIIPDVAGPEQAAFPFRRTVKRWRERERERERQPRMPSRSCLKRSANGRMLCLRPWQHCVAWTAAGRRMAVTPDCMDAAPVRLAVKPEQTRSGGGPAGRQTAPRNRRRSLRPRTGGRRLARRQRDALEAAAVVAPGRGGTRRRTGRRMSAGNDTGRAAGAGPGVARRRGAD